MEHVAWRPRIAERVRVGVSFTHDAEYGFGAEPRGTRPRVRSWSSRYKPLESTEWS